MCPWKHKSWLNSKEEKKSWQLFFYFCNKHSAGVLELYISFLFLSIFFCFTNLFMLSGFVFCLSFIPKEFGRFLFFSSLFVHNFFGLAEKKKMFSTLKKKRSGRRKKTPNINQEDFDADLYSSSHGDRHRRRIKKKISIQLLPAPTPKAIPMRLHLSLFTRQINIPSTCTITSIWVSNIK